MILHGKVTFRSLAERAKADVNKMAAKVRDPEGDVEPRVYLYSPAHGVLHVHDLPRQWFSSRESKDILVQGVITTLIEIGGVTLVAFQTTTYLSKIGLDRLTPEEEDAIRERHVRPDWMPAASEDPDRIEQVSVHVFDAEIREMWTREITRTPGRRPRFGAWQLVPEMVTGMIIDPIVEALR